MERESGWADSNRRLPGPEPGALASALQPVFASETEDTVKLSECQLNIPRIPYFRSLTGTVIHANLSQYSSPESPVSNRRKGRTMGSTTKKKNNVSAPNNTKKNNLMIGTIIILVITIVSFVLVPAIAGLDSFAGNLELGRFGNKPIKWAEGNFFAKQLAYRKEQYSQYMTSETDPATAEWLNRITWQTAFDDTLSRMAILYYIEKSGFDVSSGLVDKTIAQYFTQDGVFDQMGWQNQSSREKLIIRNQTKENLALQTYGTDVFYSQLNSENQTEYLKGLGSEMRNVRFILFKMEDFPQLKVTEYGTTHADSFKKVRLGRITIEKKSEVEAIRKSVLSGEKNFEELAMELSLDGYAQVGGDLGWIYMHSLKDSLKENQMESVLALKKGEISDPIQTAYGWAIYMMKEEVSDPDFNDPTTLEEVRNYIIQNEAGLVEDYLMERATSFTQEARQNGFDNTAEQFGKTPEETGLFPLNYNVRFIKGMVSYTVESLAMAGVDSSTDFYLSCFDLDEKGDITEPVLLDRVVGVFMLIDRMDVTSNVDDRALGSFSRDAKERYFNEIIKKSPLFVDKFDETYAKIFKPTAK